MIKNFPNPATDYQAWRIATGIPDFPSFVKLLCQIRDAIGFEPKRILDFGYGWGISQCLWLTSFPDTTVTCYDPLAQGKYAGADPVADLPQPCLDRWKFTQGYAENELATDVEPFDFIFVDADHKYASTLAQVRLSWDKLLDGGVMAGHDWNDPNVRRAVAEFTVGKQIRGRTWDIDEGGWMLRK
ncbi:MAG: class I SAM-dependent methyltransferase [Candidatus Peribacteraceae bacterium]|nr:class I SAM-dependent methyltransferase [Candidatus Peribacteraceae bacterium]